MVRVSNRCGSHVGHVCMASLSLWTAWRARNSELIILFFDMVVGVCICEVDPSWLLHAALPCCDVS